MLKLILAASGLTLPGHAVARMLGLRLRWAVAFPFSALLLTGLIIAFSLTGTSIALPAVGPALGGLTLLCYWVSRGKTDAGEEIAHDATAAETPLKVAALALAGLIVTAVALRATLYPLSGYDTYFRWEALARAMLSHKSLNYYPPVSAADYSIYLFTDGIPPLVSTVYWWLYAVMGRPVEQVTSLSVILQLIATMLLTFYAMRYHLNARAAYFSLVALATSTLLIDGFAMGQESGFLALSIAGQLCFAQAAVRTPKSSLVIAAALFAALGCLSRDYGPVLALSGFTLLAWYPATRRFLLLYAIVTALLSAPWYLRSWAITGNPLYSHPIPGGFKTNAVHTAMVASYREIYSFSQLDSSQWLSLVIVLLTGATLALVGVLHSIKRWRESVPIIFTVGLVTLLWAASVPQTAGGLIYSMRVLVPAVVALSMLAGAAYNDYMYDFIRKRSIVVRITVLCISGSIALYSLVFAASHPHAPRELFTAITSKHQSPPEFCRDMEKLVDRMNAADLPPAGVLTDDQYLAILLQRNSRFRPVLLWSPEVKFIFEPNLSAKEIQRRLIALNVTMVIFENSPNRLFLQRIPFYKEGLPNWKQLITVPDSIELFSLSAPN